MRDYRTASLADQVYEKMEQDIILGVYPRGEVLTELKLVEQLGVSRTPIREALRRLEQERLIADTGKGSVILGITEDDLVDIMNIRLRIEGLASYYATLNATEEDLKRLENVVELQSFYYERRDIEHLEQLDGEFHDLICVMSRRAVLSDTLQPLHRKTKRYRRASIDKRHRTSRSIEEHRDIYLAVASGNAELAQELTTKHIENAMQSMMEGMNYHG